MRIAKSLTVLAALAVARPAIAHETKGPNGGRVVDAGSYHVELVVKPNDVAVYLTDAGDKPVTAAGFKGAAILMADGKAQRIALEPAQDNQLTGKTTVALPENVKGAVQLTTPDGKTAQGQFK
jgi:hypothetical protein